MHKPVVGILRGGTSSEYEVSLKTGATVLQQLPQDKYTVRDILIDKRGVWHSRGVPVAAARVLEQVDVVWNALHGAYGEDGTVQRILDTHGVRYTGSGALASGIAMNKVLTKRHLRARSAQATANGMKRVPLQFAADVVLEDGASVEQIAAIFERLSLPLIVKPATGGSSVATTVVQFREDLLYAVMNAFEHGDRVLIEQFVRGREVTVAVAEDWRGEKLYAFPPIEITPAENKWFDYEEKYGGRAREVCPAPLPYELTSALLAAAREVHQALDLRDYSRSDFIIGCDGVYFLEVNTLPGMTPQSLVPKAIEATGATLPQFLDHLTMRALSR